MNIFKFNDEQRGRDPPSQIITGKSQAAIIIDNGSFECRAGLSSSKAPDLVFKNLAFRQKGKNNDPDLVLVGRDIENLETVRSQLKSPFDRNVVTQFDTQEMICDYIFSKLNVNTEQCVDYPVVMSEPVANPNHSRKLMSELMFECYSVPAITYYTDVMGSWYSMYSNRPAQYDTGVCIHIGYQMSHVVPVVGGRVVMENVRRIAVGGYHLDFFMQRLLQLKYPIHSNVISPTRAEFIVQNHTAVAHDYKQTCLQWMDIPYYDKKVHKMQLPYGNVPANFAAVALQGERQVERAKLMKEKQAIEKLENKKQILDQLCEIREMTGTKLHRKLAEMNVDSTGELQCHIKAVRATVEDLKRKITMKEAFNSGILTQQWLQEKIDKLDNADTVADHSNFDVAEYYQLHIGIEQVRVPEVIFQPSMVGVEQGGISETLTYVINKFPEDTQSQLAKNVVLSGGCARIPGLRERLQSELTSCRPFKSEINVHMATEPVYGGWLGARSWYTNTEHVTDSMITKAMYEEYGGEYFKEHALSNVYFPTPSQSIPAPVK